MKQRQWQQFKANSNCQGTVYRAIYEEDKFLMLIGLYSKASVAKDSSGKWRRTGGKQGKVDRLGPRREETTKLSSESNSTLHCEAEALPRLTLDSLHWYLLRLHNISRETTISNIKLSLNSWHQIPLQRALPNSSGSVAVEEGDDAFFLVYGRKQVTCGPINTIYQNWRTTTPSEWVL